MNLGDRQIAKGRMKYNGSDQLDRFFYTVFGFWVRFRFAVGHSTMSVHMSYMNRDQPSRR